MGARRRYLPLHARGRASKIADIIAHEMAHCVDYMHMFALTHSPGLRDEHLQTLAANFPGISMVHLDACRRVTDIGLTAVLSAPPTQGKGLRVLSLCGVREGQVWRCVCWG